MRYVEPLGSRLKHSPSPRPSRQPIAPSRRSTHHRTPEPLEPPTRRCRPAPPPPHVAHPAPRPRFMLCLAGLYTATPALSTFVYVSRHRGAGAALGNPGSIPSGRWMGRLNDLCLVRSQRPPNPRKEQPRRTGPLSPLLHREHSGPRLILHHDFTLAGPLTTA